MRHAVRIYQPGKTAMQSGRAGTKAWVMEFEPEQPVRPDQLMGWAGSGDTRRQIRLSFDTLEEATAYAERMGLAHSVEQPHAQRFRPRSYADNFRPERVRR